MSNLTFVGNKDSFKERSKRRIVYKGGKWCQIHPTSIWAEGYTQCAQGFRLHQFCKEGGK